MESVLLTYSRLPLRPREEIRRRISRSEGERHRHENPGPCSAIGKGRPYRQPEMVDRICENSRGSRKPKPPHRQRHEQEEACASHDWKRRYRILDRSRRKCEKNRLGRAPPRSDKLSDCQKQRKARARKLGQQLLRRTAQDERDKGKCQMDETISHGG